VIYTKYISGKDCCQIYILFSSLWCILGVRSSMTLESVLNTKTIMLEFFERNYSTYLNNVDIWNSVNVIQIPSLPMYHTSWIFWLNFRLILYCIIIELMALGNSGSPIKVIFVMLTLDSINWHLSNCLLYLRNTPRGIDEDSYHVCHESANREQK
jgi:hypothetical protein